MVKFYSIADFRSTLFTPVSCSVHMNTRGMTQPTTPMFTFAIDEVHIFISNMLTGSYNSKNMYIKVVLLPQANFGIYDAFRASEKRSPAV